MKSGLVFLKVIALAGTVLSVFPLIVFAQVFDFGLFIPLRALNCCFTGGAALGVGMLLDKPADSVGNPRYRHIYLISAKTVTLASGLFVILLRGFIDFGDTELFLLVIFISFCCSQGFKNRKKGFQDIFSFAMLCAFSIISVLFLFFISAYDAEIANAKSALVYVCVVEYTIAAILLNQSNIEKQANRRRDINAQIPRNLRLYNISLILPIVLLFGFGYMFRSYIQGIMYFIGGVVSKVLAKLLETTVSFEDASTEDVAEVAENYSDEPLLGIIVIIILAAYLTGIVFILVKIRFAIWDAVKSTFKWFLSLFKIKKREEKYTAAFTDYFEDIVYEKRKKQDKPELKYLIRLYKKEKRPNVKIRLSYQIFLLWLVNKGANISPSDTVQAHFKNIDNPEDFSDYSKTYSSVRYGETSGEGGVKSADEIVKGCGG